MDIHEYYKIINAMQMVDFSLPQSGIVFKFGEFLCELNAAHTHLLCKDAGSYHFLFNNKPFIEICLSDNSISKATMKAGRIWKLLRLFPERQPVAYILDRTDEYETDSEAM